MKLVAVALLLIVSSCIVGLSLNPSTNRSQPADAFAGFRGACKVFLERQITGGDYGAYWDWTVVDNRDGTFSVGAKYLRANKAQEYTTCILRRSGDDYSLVKLSRLQ